MIAANRGVRKPPGACVRASGGFLPRPPWLRTRLPPSIASSLWRQLRALGCACALSHVSLDPTRPNRRAAACADEGAGRGADRAGAAALSHLDHCLACRNCERVCPAPVRYGELLLTSRAALRVARRVPAMQRVLEMTLRRPRLRDAMFAARAACGLCCRHGFDACRRRIARRCRSPRARTQTRLGRTVRRLPRRHQDAATAAAAHHVLERLGWSVQVRRGAGLLRRTASARRQRGAMPNNCSALNRAAFAAGNRHRGISPSPRLHESIAQSFAGRRATPLVDALEFLASDSRIDSLSFRAWRGDGAFALHLPCTPAQRVAHSSRVAPLLGAIPVSRWRRCRKPAAAARLAPHAGVPERADRCVRRCSMRSGTTPTTTCSAPTSAVACTCRPASRSADSTSRAPPAGTARGAPA